MATDTNYPFNGGSTSGGEPVTTGDLKPLTMLYREENAPKDSSVAYNPLQERTVRYGRFVLKQGSKSYSFGAFDKDKEFNLDAGSEVFELDSSGLSNTSELHADITADIINGIEPVIKYAFSENEYGYFHLDSSTQTEYTFHGKFGQSSFYEITIGDTGALTEIVYVDEEPEIKFGSGQGTMAASTDTSVVVYDSDSQPVVLGGKKYQVNVEVRLQSSGAGVSYCPIRIEAQVDGNIVYGTNFTIDDSIEELQCHSFSFCRKEALSGPLRIYVRNTATVSTLTATAFASVHSVDGAGSSGGGGGGSSSSSLKAIENMPITTANADIPVYLNNGNWNVAVGFIITPMGDVDLSDGNLALEYRVLQGGSDGSAQYRLLVYELDDSTEASAVQEANLIAYGSLNHPSGNYGTCREKLTLLNGIDKLDGTKQYYVVFLTDTSNFWTYTGVHLAGVSTTALNSYPQLCGHVTSPASVNASTDIANLGTIQFGSWSVNAIPYFRIINKSVTERKM